MFQDVPRCSNTFDFFDTLATGSPTRRMKEAHQQQGSLPSGWRRQRDTTRASRSIAMLAVSAKHQSGKAWQSMAKHTASQSSKGNATGMQRECEGKHHGWSKGMRSKARHVQKKLQIKDRIVSQLMICSLRLNNIKMHIILIQKERPHACWRQAR